MRTSVFITALFFSLPLWAEDQRFVIKGSARARAEFRDNSDFSGSSKDYVDFVGSRFRLDLNAKVNEKAFVFVQPQFTKVWGEPEFVPSSSTGNTSTNTSGATNDTPLDVHQAYVSYSHTERFSYAFGRRELNYGDELLVGGVGWSNTGRSFDLLQVNYQHDRGSIEAFHSRLVDRNVSASGLGDRDFSGLYSSNRFPDWFQAADGYVFYLDDPALGPAASTLALGLRLKSKVGSFDYRAEMTFEKVKSASTSDEAQFDAEIGFVVHEGKSLRLAAGYFHASDDFDQLFPTGHKWLGYADLFSRRNIQGYRARISAEPFAGWTASLDYHRFERVKTSESAYKFGGTAYGTSGTNREIADEADLVISHKVDENITLEGGMARVMPGSYLKANGGSDEASFYYVQVATAF